MSADVERQPGGMQVVRKGDADEARSRRQKHEL